MTDDTPLLARRLPNGEPAFVTQAAYAEMRGVTKAAATKWKHAGLLVLIDAPTRTGKAVDVAASDARRAGEQNPLKRAAPASAPTSPSSPGDLFAGPPPAGSSTALRDASAEHAAPESSEPDGQSSSAGPPADDPLKRAAAELRLDRERWRKVKEEAEARQIIGELAPVSLVAERSAARAARLKQELAQLPARVAERCGLDPDATRRVTAAAAEAVTETVERFLKAERARLAPAAPSTSADRERQPAHAG